MYLFQEKRTRGQQEDQEAQMTTPGVLWGAQPSWGKWRLTGGPQWLWIPQSSPHPSGEMLQKKAAEQACGRRRTGTFCVYQESCGTLVDSVGGGSSSPGCMGETSQ